MPRRSDKAVLPGSSAVGVIMLLIAAGFAAAPQGRNWPVIAAAASAGLLFQIIGSDHIYRPAVSRAGNAVTCRFNPWREGAFYLVLVGVPLIAVIPIAGGTSSGRGAPSFWLVLGAFLLAIAARFAFVFARQARRSVLRVSPGALTLSQTSPRYALTEIPRGAVQAITATTGRLRNHGSAPVTQITFRRTDSISSSPQTVVFGPTNTKQTAWLTVDQSDLLAGLQAWKDGDPEDPDLMQRVERILCGQGPTNV